MNYLLDTDDIEGMLEHWNSTPANAYRGSRYGENHNRMLFNSMSTDVADIIVEKLRADIPIFGSLASNTIQVESENIGFDQKRLILSVGQVSIPISENSEQENYTGDTFYANAK